MEGDPSSRESNAPVKSTNAQKMNQQSAHGLIGALSFFRSF
ncbi:hypothetical protein J2Z32_001873 [Paenibacillus turicensis]|uniref:Uncharacterized protein n=1 Tax=Paenibacillus turicensis TaxID=160487 RepID=A0ABS4FRS0_9BACL|nr:hypothetical protein [Paenibacillus turicensis]MBP1905245.1 hypothetical protein [Paenibacillus turicensis]